MAKKKRRRARKTSSLRKTWRFTQKQRRRRRRMHPTRRRQETASIFIGLSVLPLLFFIGIPAAVFAGVASGFIGFVSKASPPPKKAERKRRPKNLLKGGEKFSGNFSGKEAIKLKKKASSCSDACKRSTHPKNTCDCICNGSQHGVEAGMYGGPGPATTKPRTRKPKTRKTRSQARK